MTTSIWLPLAVAVLAALATGSMHRRLPPHFGARVLALTAIMSALAVAWGLVIGVFAYATQTPWIADRIGWCHVLLASHHRVPAPVGVLSVVALTVGSYRAVRWQRRCRRVIRSLARENPAVEIVALDVPAAFAVPGRPGHIVVSQAMLDCLAEDERGALFAHEQAHLDHRHHLYVRLTDVAAEAVPLLQPIRRHVRFSTERWADEVAASTVGDRQLVARAIARAALVGAKSPAGPALALTGHGVAARVEALMEPPKHATLTTAAAAGGLLGAVTLVLIGSTVQLHHLVEFAAHGCQV